MTERPIPWPRVGQGVKLRSGAVAEVLSVARGIDALRSKTEIEILVLGPTMQAAIGANWMNLYYEATVQLPSMALLVVTPREVVEVVDCP